MISLHASSLFFTFFLNKNASVTSSWEMIRLAFCLTHVVDMHAGVKFYMLPHNRALLECHLLSDFMQVSCIYLCCMFWFHTFHV